MSDKDAHAGLYAGLGFLVTRALAKGLTKPVHAWMALAAVVFAALYGVSDECHQLFVPRRQFELLDMAADAVGGMLGAGALWLWSIIRESRHAV